jgi:hypothetical protein
MRKPSRSGFEKGVNDFIVLIRRITHKMQEYQYYLVRMIPAAMSYERQMEGQV